MRRAHMCTPPFATGPATQRRQRRGHQTSKVPGSNSAGVRPGLFHDCRHARAMSCMAAGGATGRPLLRRAEACLPRHCAAAGESIGSGPGGCGTGPWSGSGQARAGGQSAGGGAAAPVIKQPRCCEAAGGSLHPEGAVGRGEGGGRRRRQPRPRPAPDSWLSVDGPKCGRPSRWDGHARPGGDRGIRHRRWCRNKEGSSVLQAARHMGAAATAAAAAAAAAPAAVVKATLSAHHSGRACAHGYVHTQGSWGRGVRGRPVGARTPLA